MQNAIHRHIPGHRTARARRLGATDTAPALSAVPRGWRAGRRRSRSVPALMAAIKVGRRAVIERKGCPIRERGKPPGFAPEVASRNTARNRRREAEIGRLPNR